MIRPGQRIASRGPSISVLCGLFLSSCLQPPELSREDRPAGELSGGETRDFLLRLDAGDYLQVVVEQIGIDLTVSLEDPAGVERIRLDSPNGNRGPERLDVVAEAAGGHRLRVEGGAGQPRGSYAMRIEAWRPATPRDRQRGAAALAFSAAEQLRRRGGAEAGDAAIDGYRRALGHWRQAGEVAQQAGTLYKIGAVHESSGRWQPAADAYRRAAEAFGELGACDPLVPHLLNRLGNSYRKTFAWEAARAAYAEALGAARELRAGTEEAAALNNLAVLYRQRGKTQRALAYYHRAIEGFRKLADRSGEATALINLGRLYLEQGQPERAAVLLRSARRLSSEARSSRTLARALTAYGTAQRRLRRWAASRQALEQALAIYRESRPGSGEILALQELGKTATDMGEYAAARRALDEALELARERGHRRLEASVRLYLGWLDSESGHLEPALAHHAAARSISQQAGSPSLMASALHAAARIERRRGELRAARASIEEALRLVEGQRAETFDRRNRMFYLANKQSYYELAIDLLAELHRGGPAQGYDRLALEVSERRRARALLDVLNEALRGLDHDATPDLLQREEALQREIDRRARQLAQRHEEDPAGGERIRLEQEVEELVIARQGVAAAIRESRARSAAFEPAPVLRLGDIQEQLDEDTVLLELALGEERSSLWWVTPSEAELFALAGRGVIEGLARQAYRLLTQSSGRRVRGQLALVLERLSECLLAPVADRLAGQRLVVVSDGALQYVPFATLPIPGARSREAAPRRLVEEHEIVHLPSMSVLALLRERLRARPRAAKLVAVVADPVFAGDARIDDPGTAAVRAAEARSAGPGLAGAARRGATDTATETPRHLQRQISSGAEAGEMSDPRHLQRRISSGAEAEAMGDPRHLQRQISSGAEAGEMSDSRHLQRLISSGAEAEAIRDLVPASQSFIALGFDATRDLVTSGALADYRYLHFATHVVFDALAPEASGVVFSQVDRSGRWRQALLRPHEIYRLHLPVDMVVLSACQSALGRQVRGEGLVGLTQGFLYAGAGRVVASAWKVDDRATAELMERFYRGIFVDGLRPAAALRAAQLALLTGARFQAPYYWAGFFLQGEWR